MPSPETTAEFARPEGTRRMLADAIKVIEDVRETLYMPPGFKILSGAVVSMMQSEIDRKDGP